MNCPISTAEKIMATPDDLFTVLRDLGISHTLHTHKAMFTVAEGIEIERNIPGRHCRNLFLRDKKETMFLVSALNETAIDLKKLSEALGAGRFSFGSSDRLWRHLGVKPGSVCPFAMMNDHDHAVTPVLDAEMMRAEIINFHPLDNTMTIGLRPADLLTFMAHFGHKPIILEMAALAPDNTNPTTPA